MLRQKALAAAGRDAPQLLHIEVQQITRMRMLIADDLARDAVKTTKAD